MTNFLKKMKAETKYPLIAVSLVGKTKDELLTEIREVRNNSVDMIEWRVDFFDGLTEQKLLLEMAYIIVEKLPGMPIIFTIRTREEGGDCWVSPVEYANSYLAIAKQTTIDFFDVQLNIGPNRDDLIEDLHQLGKNIIVSFHDVDKTPQLDALQEIFSEMKQAQGDIFKLAVMPTKKQEVLTLMQASLYAHQMYAEPIVGISMGVLGQSSRIVGKEFGSCLTFASLKQSSAPGQLTIAQLNDIYDKWGRRLPL